MTYEGFVYAAFAAALLMPALPAAFELRARRDARALDVDPDYAMDPRYFGKSFRRKIASAVRDAQPGSDIRFLGRAGEYARVVEACEIPDGGQEPYAVLARGRVSVGKNARLSDLYAAGSVRVGSGTVLRALVTDGDVSLDERVTVGRWIDAQGALQIGEGCAIAHSASAGGQCTLGDSVTFQRVFGNPIIVGATQTLRVPQYRATIDTDTISSGDVEVAAGTLHTGSIKSDGNVVVGPGARVGGSIVARGDVRLEQSSVVDGHVFAERSVVIRENAAAGASGAAKTVYAARNVVLSRGAMVHGWIICEGQGETR